MKWDVPIADIRKWKLDAMQVGGLEIHHACRRDVTSALQIQSTPAMIKKPPNGQNYEATMIAPLLKFLNADKYPPTTGDEPICLNNPHPSSARDAN
jgi:hypothetical protein